MRQHTTTVLLILISLIFCIEPSYSALKGGVKYSIPAYYSNLSEDELAEKADSYYFLAKQLKVKEINEDMTNALMLYSVLQNMNPQNIQYSVRLGILYDQLGKDRYAKGNLFRAVGINSSSCEPYFYLGEFYYKRALYRSALRYYKKSLENTDKPSYDLLYKLGDIYEKLGDTKTSLDFLRKAEAQSPNPELEKKIKKVEAYDSANQKYYSE